MSSSQKKYLLASSKTIGLRKEAILISKVNFVLLPYKTSLTPSTNITTSTSFYSIFYGSTINLIPIDYHLVNIII